MPISLLRGGNITTILKLTVKCGVVLMKLQTKVAEQD